VHAYFSLEILFQKTLVPLSIPAPIERLWVLAVAPGPRLAAETVVSAYPQTERRYNDAIHVVGESHQGL
jgi:hypothetical protein